MATGRCHSWVCAVSMLMAAVMLDALRVGETLARL